jgi:glycosyltransferase involved in cell wall biosynthesis
MPGGDARYVIVFAFTEDQDAFLGRTLDSVMRHSNPQVPVVLLSAGPSDRRPAAQGFAEALADPRVVLHSAASDTPASLGAAAGLLQEHYPEHDLLYVRCGVEVPSEWDERLRFSAYQDAVIGTASPLCDVSPLFTLVTSPVAVGVAEANAVLCRFAQRVAVQIPTFLECCVYVKAAALDAVRGAGPQGESRLADEHASALASRISLAGYVHALCDHLYVHRHFHDAAQRRMDGAVSVEIETLNRQHPLTGLRHTVNDALRQGMEGEPCVRPPVQLHLVHGWGGGLDRWVRDFAQHDAWGRNLILKAVGSWGQFGQRLELHDSPAMDRPLRVWELYSPIRGIAVAHLQYRELLNAIIAEHRVEAVLISSLIGHSLDALDAPAQTLLVLHDYLPFCPALNIFFGEVCASCDGARLRRCFQENPHNQFFTNIPAEEWLAVRRRFAALVTKNRLRLAAPSPSVERHWKRLVPELSEREFRVIPHGTSGVGRVARSPDRAPRERLRVLVLGSLAENKGGRLLKEAAPALGELADVFLVGCGREGAFFAGHPGFRVVASFSRDDLTRIVTEIDPDIGLLASVVPETFSYTLSELMLLGIPPLVSRRGSFEDRVTEGETGFFFEPTPRDLEEAIQRLAGNRGAIERVRARLAQVATPSEAEMVTRYRDLVALPLFDPVRYRRPRLDTAGGMVMPATRALTIHSEATFAEVYRDLGVYVTAKLAASARLRQWQKRPLLKALALLFPKARRATP